MLTILKKQFLKHPVKGRYFKKNKELFTGIKVISLLLVCFVIFAPLQAQKRHNEKKPESFSFVFLTDMHLEYTGNSLQYLDKAVKTINKLKPDFIMTGGDNIRDATKSTQSHADSLYNLYMSQAKRFSMPVYTGIGNHESFGINNKDINSENPLYGKKMYESKIGEHYYTFSRKGWKFFMIDGIKNTDSGNKYIGFIDDAQMEWLKNELAATDSVTPIVICSHIPIISTMKKFESGSLSGTPENDGISNSIELFNLFKHHNLKLVLQGHFHFFEVLYANNIYYITAPSPTADFGGTRKLGFFLFKTKGDNLKWEFVENRL